MTGASTSRRGSFRRGKRAQMFVLAIVPAFGERLVGLCFRVSQRASLLSQQMRSERS
jgi:hypothetical protein